MRIFSWNVNSLVPTVRNINLKYGSLEAFFKHLDADIVCMQEIKLPNAKLAKDVVIVPGYQSYWACSEGKTGYSGVTTWAKEEYAAVAAEADAIICEGLEQEGRCVMTDHGSFVLFNVYVPNAGDRPERARLDAKLAFLQALKERIDSLIDSGRQVIAVGDFNVAAEQRDVHSAITWETLYAQSELDALHTLFASVTDTWRLLHPSDEGVYTVWNERTSARAFNVGLRIDYALCSKALLGHVQACDIMLDMPPKWSDHAPIVLDLAEPTTTAPAAAAAVEASQQQQQQHGVVQCPMWRQLLKRFADPSQRSIASLFGKAGRTNSGGSSRCKTSPAAAAEAPSQQQAAAAAETATAQQVQQHPQSGGGPKDLSTAAAAAAAAVCGDSTVAATAATNAVAHAAAADNDFMLPRAKRLRTEHVTRNVDQIAVSTKTAQQQLPPQQQDVYVQEQQTAAAAPKLQAAANKGSGSTAGSSKQQAKKGSSKKQQQQQCGPKQASLHAFLTGTKPP